MKAFLQRVRRAIANWHAWLLDRINDVGALVLWLLLNVNMLPPELLAVLPQPVRLAAPAVWWALVKWAAYRKAQAAVAKANGGPGAPR